jgi:hypothetical protein
MQAPEYKNLKAISQSMLKAFKWMPIKRFKTEWIDNKKWDADDDRGEYDSDSLVLGSAVDTLLTTPSLFKDRFLIANDKVPGGKLADVVRHIFYVLCVNYDTHPDTITDPLVIQNAPETLSSFKDEYLTQCVKIDYGQKWNADTLINTVERDGSEYFEYLKKSAGRTVIAMDDNILALTMASAIKEDEFTKPWAIQADGETLRLQVVLEGVILGEPVKCAIDTMRIKHLTNTIDIGDFKITSSHNAYESSVRKYGYPFQLSFYKEIVKQNYPSYTIGDCVNIVVDSATVQPLIYGYSEERLALEREGYLTDAPIPYRYKGWQETMEELIWHIEKNEWVYPKGYRENGGIVHLAK